MLCGRFDAWRGFALCVGDLILPEPFPAPDAGARHVAEVPVLIDVVGQRAAPPFDRLADHAEMVLEPFLRFQAPSHDPPRVIILRQDQILKASQPRQPAVVGRVVMPERPGPGRFSPDVEFADFRRRLVIIASQEGPPPHAAAAQRSAKPLVRGFRKWAGCSCPNGWPPSRPRRGCRSSWAAGPRSNSRAPRAATSPPPRR